MNKTARQLRELKATKIESMQAIQAKAAAGKRSRTDEETAEWKALNEEVKALNEEIEIAERQEALDAEMAATRGTRLNNHSTQEQRDLSKFSILKICRSVIQGKALDGLEAEMHQEAVREASRSGIEIGNIGIPSMILQQRDNSITMPTQPADGAAVIVPATQRPMLDMLRNALVTRQLGAQYITDLTGNVSFTQMATRPVATWKPEVGDLDKSNVTFGAEEFGPKRLGTYTVQSKQFLLQTSPAVENKIREEIMYSIAEGVDVAAISGTGASNQPTGILTKSGVQTVAIGTNGGVPTRAVLLAAETALASANIQGRNLGWLINAATRGKLKGTETTANSGIFIMDSNNSLMEYPVVMSNMVTAAGTKGTGTNLSTAIFGDWNELIIGQWGGIDLLVDPYTLAVGGQIKIVAQGFFNVHVQRANAFVKITDIVTV